MEKIILNQNTESKKNAWDSLSTEESSENVVEPQDSERLNDNSIESEKNIKEKLNQDLANTASKLEKLSEPDLQQKAIDELNAATAFLLGKSSNISIKNAEVPGITSESSSANKTPGDSLSSQAANSQQPNSRADTLTRSNVNKQPDPKKGVKAETKNSAISKKVEATSETNTNPEELLKPKNLSDKVVDNVLDKVVNVPGNMYINNIVGHSSTEKTSEMQTATNRTKDEAKHFFANLLSRSKDKNKAQRVYSDVLDNIRSLSKNKLVGDDTIKFFLSNHLNRALRDSEYENIQLNDARKFGNNELSFIETIRKMYIETEEIGDEQLKKNGSIFWQGAHETYNHDVLANPGNFLHVNAHHMDHESSIRCYISPDVTKRPDLVLKTWWKSLQNSPLKDKLYFKFCTDFDGNKDGDQRTDTIVIYKDNQIDDKEFKTLLQDFQQRCNEQSPDLLARDERQMPAAANRIADGISISAEPDYVNDILKAEDVFGPYKHSWTTFVDRMMSSSITLANIRLGGKEDPKSMTPALRKETKKVFRELMLLSKINPDTMMPESYGDSLPSWANLN